MILLYRSLSMVGMHIFLDGYIYSLPVKYKYTVTLSS
jgi:hypothetical protein